MNTNIVWQSALVSKGDREALLSQRGAVLWFTGLSGSGKSTIATRVEKALCDEGRAAYLLDGDNLRHGLNAGLGFSEADRAENIRRIAEVAALMADAGLIVLVSAISPLHSMRAMARECVEKRAIFAEIYVKANVTVCAARDPKGLYARALRGEIPQFTGVSAPYEAPESPDLTLDTAAQSIDESVQAALELAERMTIPMDTLLNRAIDASLRAGQAIMEIYNRDFAVSFKADSSPLTEADQASDALIAAALRPAFPRYAYLSEEEADNLDRLNNPFCFIVDPLDGTKEFIRKNGEFTVNIALAHRGRSVMGVIYVPAQDTFYYAAEGVGAFVCEQALSHKSDVRAASRPIHVSNRTEKLVMMVSRSHLDEDTKRLMDENADRIGAVLASGSSIKGCLVARGEADLYYRTGPTMEWDTAAMQCIAEQAGALVRQGDDTPLTYNRHDSRNSKGFYIINSAQNHLRRA